MIEDWLEQFHDAWKRHDIDAVMDLFTDDVEYWETPHYRIESKQELEKEWQAIKIQQNIQIETKLFSSADDNKHTVIWNLSYENNGNTHKSAGTYLISLNEEGKCYFFHYTGESKKATTDE